MAENQDRVNAERAAAAAAEAREAANRAKWDAERVVERAASAAAEAREAANRAKWDAERVVERAAATAAEAREAADRNKWDAERVVERAAAVAAEARQAAEWDAERAVERQPLLQRRHERRQRRPSGPPLLRRRPRWQRRPTGPPRLRQRHDRRPIGQPSWQLRPTPESPAPYRASVEAAMSEVTALLDQYEHSGRSWESCLAKTRSSGRPAEPRLDRSVSIRVRAKAGHQSCTAPAARPAHHRDGRCRRAGLR